MQSCAKYLARKVPLPSQMVPLHVPFFVVETAGFPEEKQLTEILTSPLLSCFLWLLAWQDSSSSFLIRANYVTDRMHLTGHQIVIATQVF